MHVFTPPPSLVTRYLDNATALKVAFTFQPDWWYGDSIYELKANLDLGGWYSGDFRIRLGVQSFGCVRRFVLEAATSEELDRFLASLD